MARHAIGANLRRHRLARGLSLAALAQSSGVAKATLTKLESGAGNPTVDTLYALADSLGVALGELIADPPATSVQVVRAGEGPRVRGALSARLLDRVYGHGLVELYELSLTPRTRRAAPHPAGVVESLFVTEGTARVGPLDELVDLEPGDFLRFPGDRPHAYAALGEGARAVLAMSYP
jgi:transcriptional regulator with XRE-family HTH domain